MDGRSSEPARSASLRGRMEECAQLNDLLADVRRGESRSLVLRGEPGIGKTALLEFLVAGASDFDVLQATGVESEMELAYASLHQLCAPLLNRLGGLPPPQHQALEIVFGLSVGPPPDRFLVGLAALSLLSEVAEDRPLLCVIDDAQWLDHASAQTLAFVSRRLLAERVGIVFATREPSDELQHQPELEVRGLRNGDARWLLSSSVRFRLDDQVTDRIVAETRGNPLALLELPRGLTATQLAGGFGLMEPDALGLPSRIEQAFVRRIESVPEETRLLLLVAAAEPVGDPLLLWGAAERLGIDPGAAKATGAERLLTIGERVTFRHPLVRSAVYRSAAPEDRRRVHSALAAATNEQLDPDRRAWHLADAAAGPDEQIAAELERSAGRAQARGGAAAAAAFLRRAVELTRDPEPRADRALAAAEAHLYAGAFDEALRLSAIAEAGSPDEMRRARVELLRGRIAFASSYGGDALVLLLDAARRLEPLDPALARETYLDAWGAALMAGRAGAQALPEVSQAALAAPQPTSAPRLSDLLLDGWSLAVTEGSPGTPKLSRAVSLMVDGGVDSTDALRWGWYAALAACCLWDIEGWHGIAVRLVQIAREAGFLVEQQLHLTVVGNVAICRGDFAAAASRITEIDALAEATRTRLARYAAVQLAGFRGREAETHALIEVEVKNALAARQDVAIWWCQWVSAVLYNGLGRYDAALAAARQAIEVRPDMGVTAWSLVEVVEAAARAGKPELGAEPLERLAVAANAGGTDWGLGVLARSRALLSEGDDAEDSYREAVERLGRTELRPDLGRAHLLYGEWLRRENRRRDARVELRAAYEDFAAIGMEAFAERARTELRATGETVRARGPESRDELTAQERHIAELAGNGLSNPEIGARLFLSPRTIEFHLRKVYTKLRISSRRDLRTALSRSETALTA
jgi:DNA-binding CsgD family transcriptional regulator/tetratricopeptide (TPR) repeat protein